MARFFLLRQENKGFGDPVAAFVAMSLPPLFQAAVIGGNAQTKAERGRNTAGKATSANVRGEA
jgi:hypothetical protein